MGPVKPDHPWSGGLVLAVPVALALLAGGAVQLAVAFLGRVAQHQHGKRWPALAPEMSSVAVTGP